jgi:hypothetical protein
MSASPGTRRVGGTLLKRVSVAGGSCVFLVLMGNAGIRACAKIPALADGYSGIFYSWTGEITTYKGDCG